MSVKKVVIETKNLKKHFPVAGAVFRTITGGGQKYVHAVDGVTFKIYKGETFGLVGESGCGKSTTGVLILQLLDRTSGEIYFKGIETSEYTRKQLWISTIRSFFHFIFGTLKREEREREEADQDVTKVSKKSKKKKKKKKKYKYKIVRIDWKDVKNTFQEYRKRVLLFRKNIQIVFQNPYESLSPRFNVLDTIAEPLRLMNIVEDELEIEKMVINELEEVGLVPGTEFLDRYPHELSGGQRQRVGVARAFILDPEFVVADEPVSMLDVSVRVGVLKIMRELTKRRGTGFLFITHDLALARHMCDRIAVMYLGRIVEQGPTEELIRKPLHPYTKALIKAVPTADPDARRTEDLPIEGEVPSGIDIPEGCRFHPRCPYVADECKLTDPVLESAKEDYMVACIRFRKINEL
ncbi:MAG: ABC transporter ATP-binding protein [Candidatus Heimdallarchaeota archaeon]|nr:ABC transporter ATP-binding protein [Candidatus Heimdallarchaeota archaeon]